MPTDQEVKSSLNDTIVTSSKQRHRCGPRVKTGCLTCRVRRVKCDESRPACRRCTSTGRQCDGYAHLMHEFTSTPSQPKSTNHVASVGQINSYEIPFSIPGSQRDRQLFHYYCVYGARDLAGYLNSTLWYDMILAYSEQAPVVRQAVIAFSTTQLRLIHCKNHVLSDGSLEHLKQYDKAVRWLRKYLSSTHRLKTNVVLSTCALLFATCAARGEMGEGFQHIESGLLILRNTAAWSQLNLISLSSRESSPMPSESGSSSEDDELNLVPDEIRRFFEHLEKELKVHEMVQDQSHLSIVATDLAIRSLQDWRVSVNAAIELTGKRLNQLSQFSISQSVDEEAQNRHSETADEYRTFTTLQLVSKWASLTINNTTTTDDAGADSNQKSVEITKTHKKRLSILSLDIWLSILRSAFPNDTAVWSMCPNPLIEAYIVLRERIASFILCWIATVSGKVVEDDILRTSIELSTVVPLTLLAKQNINDNFSQTIWHTLNMMLLHGHYDGSRAAAILGQLSI